MTDETKILFDRLIEAINSPDWWTIGITAVNAVIMVWLGWKQYKLQKQQNKIQEYQTELQKQQTIAQQRQTEALEYEIYRRLYVLLSNANWEIKEFLSEIDYALWEPVFNHDKECLERKLIKIEKMKQDLVENNIDYKLKFSKEIFDNDGYREILSLMEYILQELIKLLKAGNINILQGERIKIIRIGEKDKIDVDDIVSHFKTKNTQNFFRQCFGLFIKQKKELAINDDLINEIRNRCKIQ